MAADTTSDAQCHLEGFASCRADPGYSAETCALRNFKCFSRTAPQCKLDAQCKSVKARCVNTVDGESSLFCRRLTLGGKCRCTDPQRLIKAVRANDVGMVKTLCANREADVNAHDQTRSTALMLAVRSQNLEMVNAILGVPGLNVNAVRGWNLTTALWMAVNTGNLEIVEVILSVPGVNANVGDVSPLTLAAHQKNIHIVRALLKAGAVVDAHAYSAAARDNKVLDALLPALGEFEEEPFNAERGKTLIRNIDYDVQPDWVNFVYSVVIDHKNMLITYGTKKTAAAARLAAARAADVFGVALITAFVYSSLTQASIDDESIKPADQDTALVLREVSEKLHYLILDMVHIKVNTDTLLARFDNVLKQLDAAAAAMIGGGAAWFGLKPPSLAGGRYVYHGTFGCTLAPPLAYEGGGGEVKMGKIGKVMHYTDALKEWTQLERMIDIDPGQQFGIYADGKPVHVIQAEAAASAEGEQELRKCETVDAIESLLTNREENTPLEKKAYQLIMTRALGDVSHVVQALSTRAMSLARVQAHMRALRNLYAGLVHMHANRMCHLDIKPTNVVVVGASEEAPEAYKFIDFGSAHSFTELLDAPHPYTTALGQSYMFYPLVAYVLWHAYRRTAARRTRKPSTVV